MVKRPADAPPLLALVVPCHNEEAIIAESIKILTDKLSGWADGGLIDRSSFCCFVDDGSDDRTWEILAAAASPMVCCLKLAHNVGHQNALFAGLVHVTDKVDCCVSLDADLQDDLNAIPEMLGHYGQGSDVVYGVRAKRDSDSFLKRSFANTYYWLAKKLGIAGIPNHADFRLMSRRALLVLGQFRESHIYLRGIIPMLNLPAAEVRYDRLPRIGGVSKYTPAKLIALALDGITSFSIVPLRLITLMGFVISTLSLYFVAKYIYAHTQDAPLVPGWTTIMVSLYFLGGLIMLSLGIIGEYLAKIFIESKKRPLYVVEKISPGNNT